MFFQDKKVYFIFGLSLCFETETRIVYFNCLRKMYLKVGNHMNKTPSEFFKMIILPLLSAFQVR